MTFLNSSSTIISSSILLEVELELKLLMSVTVEVLEMEALLLLEFVLLLVTKGALRKGRIFSKSFDSRSE